MTLVQAAQFIGVVGAFLLFCLQFVIAVVEKYYKKAGRTTLLYTSIYIFFLFFLRLVSYTNLATQTELRVVSGFAILIPLIATVVQMFMNKKIEIPKKFEDVINPKDEVIKVVTLKEGQVK